MDLPHLAVRVRDRRDRVSDALSDVLIVRRRQNPESEDLPMPDAGSQIPGRGSRSKIGTEFRRATE
jgi:hypothetical protein